MEIYADVVIDISLKQLDKTFQYRVPEHLKEDVKAGTLVNIPFGKGDRAVEGVVIFLSDIPKLEKNKIKDIESIKKGALIYEEQMIALASFIRENYGSNMMQALKTVMPIKRAVKKRKKNEDFILYNDEYKDTKEKEIVLTASQSYAVNTISNDYDNGIRKTYLLHGVTGSGKTEVYMQLIDKMLSLGKETIVLIPEIALTYQTVKRFRERFKDQVLIMHSRLSAGEKYEEFLLSGSGEKKIMVGPRSALFTPFKNLGLIIIDEEHEQTYKSEQVPKYHARETAIKRASLSGASVLLGSATPSLESYEKAKSGEYSLLTLKNRVTENDLPECKIIDLRQELKSGNKTMLSRFLKEKIDDRLNKGEQVILFLNRRGMIGSISCRSCGEVIKCPHCDVPLTLHKNKLLMCHYCGHFEVSKSTCKKCGSKYIGGFKAGTEKVEDLIKSTFPKARVLRMDGDTTKGKNGHEMILKKFSEKKADILIGTQMIVKGHDFPGVTLVGILAADLSLNESDFRAGEKTFQLLTQAAGRAGRGDVPGEVIIQTYQPDHYAIRFASKQDYESFYEKEIAYRRLLKYPPSSHLLLITISSEKELKAAGNAALLADHIKTLRGNYEMFGPQDPAVKKINDTFRKIIYIKSESYTDLILIKDRAEDLIKDFPAFRDTFFYFDFDPMNGF